VSQQHDSSNVAILLHQLTCFLSRVTLKRSKSLSCFLRADFSNLFANEPLVHLLSTSADSHCFFKAAAPEARGSFGMMMLVRLTLERGAA
jgi:hypothetical protein